LAGIFAAGLAACFTAFTGLAGALAGLGIDFLAGADLEAAALAAVRGLLAAALLMGFAGFLD
jgi:hypothetical protein